MIFAPNQVSRLTNNTIDSLPCPEHLVVMSEKQLDYIEDAMENYEDISDFIKDEKIHEDTLVIFEDDSVYVVSALRLML